VERLSAQDALFVYAESDACPMHVGALAMLEGAPLRDATGRLDMPRIVEHFASRLRLAPILRSRLLSVPMRLGHPVWAEDPAFDASEHVREKVLPKPVTTGALYRFVEELQSTPLPRDKALWDLWLVDGLDDDRVAVVQRLHHALSDGMSAVQFATVLYDLQRKPPAVVSTAGHTRLPVTLPSSWELARRAISHQVDVQRSLGKQAMEQIRRGELQEVVGVGRLRALGTMLAQAPRSLLTVDAPTSPRRWLPVRTPLAPLQNFGRSVNSTLNDVVLALVTSAVARYCGERGARPDELHTWIPISTRRRGETQAGGNQWSGVPVTLPSSEGDLASRVKAIHEQTSKIKASGIAAELKELSALSEGVPAFAQRMLSRTRLGCGARNLHLSVSNVPGPPFGLYVLGARVLEVHPFSIIANHSALAVTTLSYQGSISFGLSAQATALPDLDRLSTLLEEEIASVTAHTTPPTAEAPQSP